MKIWATIARAVASGGRCALVTVIATKGSAPREAGARMIVTKQGFHGTIGGGTLEWRAIAQAQALMEAGSGERITAHALGPDMGQCCGGHVELATEVFTEEALPLIRDRARREAEGPFIEDRLVAGRLLHDLFGERLRTVYVLGAGHVGRALVLALAPQPFRVVWVDPRPDAFPGMVPQNATAHAADPVAILKSAPEGSLAFVMSHSHALDMNIVDAALRNPHIAEVGLIGSATKRARFEKRLREAGVAAERISALICPIGVAGIRSKLPAAIAAATVAQILVLDEMLGLAISGPEHQTSDRRRGLAG